MKSCFNPLVFLQYRNPFNSYYNLVTIRTLTSLSNEKRIQECYHLLNLPLDSKQDAVRQAFLELAKKYHPDSGSSEADMDKFVAVENAFRVLSKHNTGKSSNEEIEKIVHDIKHTAPQHRQYLSFEGVGHGTPFQRQKQYAQAKAQRAAINRPFTNDVHLTDANRKKENASENTLMKKGQQYMGKKHDIKTKYGFDRLVEDLIQESMSKGEFENLSGKGKPLKDQNRNPYVDFTTHKLNEVLINNGFTPEWITMNKEIDQDIEFLKRDIRNERMVLGPYPLNQADESKWQQICQNNRELVKTLNSKINKYNLIVPLINKQKFFVEIDKILDEILKNGPHSMNVKVEHEEEIKTVIMEHDDLLGALLKAFEEVFNFRDNKKNDQNDEKVRKERS